MTDEEVGQYIRLMCIQANKGHITKKDMFHICRTYDNDVCLKFQDRGEGKFINSVLEEICSQRRNYTESRRNNRKGKKQETEEHMNNICETYDKHMVNVNVNKDVNEIIVKGVQGDFDFSQPDVLGDELVWPFNSVRFKQLWARWKEYRYHTHRKDYKAMFSEQAALKALTGFTEDQACQAIEQAIAGKWVNLYPEKNKNNGNSKTGKPGKETPAELAAAFAERVVRSREGGEI